MLAGRQGWHRQVPQESSYDCLGAPGHAEMSEVMVEFSAGRHC